MEKESLKLTFLGTGPAFGIDGRGRDKRYESSALISFWGKKILIDAGRDFDKQSKTFERIEAVLLTHAHRDAAGGIGRLARWWEARYWEKLLIYALPETITVIKKRFKRLGFARFIPLTSGKGFRSLGLNVKPFLVKHSLTKGFPTLGFAFFKNRDHLLTYVSDVSGWDETAERLMRRAKTLIIDGAMWEKKMAAHLAIKHILPTICQWENKRIIFTQIGRSVPKHEKANQLIKAICPEAELAFDGMEVKLA